MSSNVDLQLSISLPKRKVHYYYYYYYFCVQTSLQKNNSTCVLQYGIVDAHMLPREANLINFLLIFFFSSIPRCACITSEAEINYDCLLYLLQYHEKLVYLIWLWKHEPSSSSIFLHVISPPIWLIKEYCKIYTNYNTFGYWIILYSLKSRQNIFIENVTTILWTKH